jgi:hypothetical protein
VVAPTKILGGAISFGEKGIWEVLAIIATSPHRKGLSLRRKGLGRFKNRSW